ncbi:hypothetical protein ATEIFO6365_0001058200 [Aspergillus terreus]|uniref:Uncharacterized protein n=1 Tax=Aspergillus terreus TaxID=33178 RepID=A0A5M3YPY5_ASPTE|nr:hypothetical protein ATETN484_0001050300 [Aspergillus terreus]GFF12359.1 hypothetical protein ATEIFO6365_0001058200 [Aspergillus terreus]
MVIGAAGTDSASSSREYGLTFEIGPPTAVRPGVPFTLPVVVGVRPVGGGAAGAGSVQQLVMHASLRNETGPAPGLTGTLTSSVRSRIGNTTSGYARFSPLVIAAPGRYRLRVMLGAASAGGVTTRAYTDSGIIQVHAAAAPSQRPTPAQVVTLQSLIPENVDITAGDIAAWQRA